MRINLLVVLLTLVLTMPCIGQDIYKPVGSYKIGNKLYENGDYQNAIKEYELIVSQDKESPELFYNLGCAWYKEGRLPHAILNFEKAHKLAPNDKDISFNLELASEQTGDDIKPLPELFLATWWRYFYRLFGIDTWAILAIISMIIGISLLTMFKIANKAKTRKTGLWLGVTMLFVSLLIFSLASQHYRYLNNQNMGIVFTPTLTVKSAPDESGTDLFVIHEGTKVQIIEEVEEWVEIKLQNGEIGWINRSEIQLI